MLCMQLWQAHGIMPKVLCRWPEMYMMSGPPFKRKGDAVLDRRGEEIELMGASAAIMHRLTTDPLFAACKLVPQPPNLTLTSLQP